MVNSNGIEQQRLFDLNVEDVLENWEPYHALREIIANALDEQTLTGTNPPRIYRDSAGSWHIQDFGRGLQPQHFTQNENPEKLNAHSGIIGKFGVGLKDALATLYRHNIRVIIRSPHGRFTVVHSAKHGFSEISTLHVAVQQDIAREVGTDVELIGLQDSDVTRAKNLFRIFSSETERDTTQFGSILLRLAGKPARIYINGVLASEEANFLFSYDISSLTDSMRKSLNRERTDIGRSVYTERVKTILKNASDASVLDEIANQVEMRAVGLQADEMQWIEISQLAFNLLSQRRQVAFLTEEEVEERPELVDTIRRDGIKPIIVSGTQRAKIEQQATQGGEVLRTLPVYVQQYNATFEYKFISDSALTPTEHQVLMRGKDILSLLGIEAKWMDRVKISETLRPAIDDTLGVWDAARQEIIVKRTQLASISSFAGTLLHEIAHVTSGAPDINRVFELELTKFLGTTASEAI